MAKKLSAAEEIKQAQEGWIAGSNMVKFRITLIEEMLGTAPGSKEVYSDYIASKAPDAAKVEDEIETIGVEGVIQNGMTVFHRDPATKEPLMYDYVIKGFLKNACKALREVKDSGPSALSAYKSRIDNLVFAYPRQIKIKNFDISDMDICERPLRASTAQGERVALASSETIPVGATMCFYLDFLTDNMKKNVIEMMEYGRLNGLGQWHNGGKGRFVYEILDANGNVIGGNKERYEKMQEFLANDPDIN